MSENETGITDPECVEVPARFRETTSCRLSSPGDCREQSSSLFRQHLCRRLHLTGHDCSGCLGEMVSPNCLQHGLGTDAHFRIVFNPELNANLRELFLGNKTLSDTTKEEVKEVREETKGVKKDQPMTGSKTSGFKSSFKPLSAVSEPPPIKAVELLKAEGPAKPVKPGKTMKPVNGKASRPRAEDFADDDMELDEKSGKEDLDGEAMKEDVDGEAMDEDLDGEAMKDDLDGEVMDDDLDGEAIPDDLDGDPM